MQLYQINVIGQCDVVSDQFKAHSKKVYMHYPAQEEIDEFIQRCSTGGFINLKTDAHYDVVIIELEVVE